MFNSLFDTEKGFWRFCGLLADIFMLSLLWFICSLPVITVASSTAALYDAVSRCLVPKEPGIYHRFWNTYKSNIKKGIPLSIIIAVLCYVIIFNFGYLYAGMAQGIEFFFIVFFASCIVLIIPVSFICWLCVIFSRYEQSFNELITNSFKFVFAHLFTSIVMTVIVTVSVILCIAFALPIAFMPCIWALISHPLIEKSFSKHK